MSEMEIRSTAMKDWHFQDSPQRFEAFDAALRERILSLLDCASEAKKQASPLLSQFSVGAAFDLGGSRRSQGCNIEYGAGPGRAESRGIHAEAAAMGNAKILYGSDARVEIAAVVGESSEILPCCGDCLDIIMSYAHPDILMVNASMQTGSAKIFRLSDLFPTAYEELPLSKRSAAQKKLSSAALRSAELGLCTYSLPALGRTGAAARTDEGEIFWGTREDSAMFHPISAIESTLAACRAAGNPPVQAIAVLSKDGQISGRDRQRIFDKAEEMNRLDSLEVLLCVCPSLENDIHQIFQTTPQKLFPHAFCSSHLRE